MHFKKNMYISCVAFQCLIATPHKKNIDIKSIGFRTALHNNCKRALKNHPKGAEKLKAISTQLQNKKSK